MFGSCFAVLDVVAVVLFCWLELVVWRLRWFCGFDLVAGVCAFGSLVCLLLSGGFCGFAGFVGC